MKLPKSIQKALDKLITKLEKELAESTKITPKKLGVKKKPKLTKKQYREG